MTSGPATTELEVALAHIDTLNDDLKTFITVTGNQARRDAEAADKAAADGQWLGLLHGMSILIKAMLVSFYYCIHIFRLFHSR